MPEISVEVPSNVLTRFQQIADERSCPVADVVRHFLTVAVGVYDSAPTPDEITARVASFGPQVARPVIDRQWLRSMADRYMPHPPPGGPTPG